MKKVAVVGVGTSKFGNRADVSLPELAWEAVKEALDDARLGPEDVQGFVVGNVGGWSSEALPAVVVGEYCGLVPKSGIRVEAACATGSAAVRTAYHMIASGGAWHVDFSELKKAYEYALDNGINFIDTAEVYGNGRSEEFVGELVRGRPHVVVATKVAGFHWGRLLKSAERSRRRLGRVDLLQLHWPPPFYVPICKVIRDMEKAVERGLTAEIGVSNFDLGLMKKAKTCAKKYELVSDQVVYNALHRAAEPLLEAGKRLGFVVIAWSPLAKGAAVKEAVGRDRARALDPAVKRAQTPEGRRVVATIRRIAERRGASPAAVVLAWHAAKGTYPIPGIKNTTQAREAVEATRLTLTEGEVREIDEASAPFVAGSLWPGVMRVIPGYLQKLAFTLARV